MTVRGPDDPVCCTWCGHPLDASYALAEFGICEPCNRKLDDAFIAGFGLREGDHYDKGPGGDVTAWCGDVTVFASAAWSTICKAEEAWEDVPLGELVRWTRDFLAYCHGRLPAPFGEPDV
jgi:hypothetical protein